MPTIKLSSGFDIPQIGLGTAGNKSKESFYNALVEAKYTHIDTAARYGNEDQIGEALAEAIQEQKIKREDIFVTTKLWHDSYEDPEQALRDSLKRL